MPDGLGSYSVGSYSKDMATVHIRTFELMVTQSVEKLPLGFRKRLRNVAFVVEAESAEGDLLGLYEGGGAFHMPDKITIYQRPHEQSTRNLRQLQKLIDETVWHEVAHYFGLNESQVMRAERRRARNSL